jgi:hypothetical protein
MITRVLAKPHVGAAEDHQVVEAEDHQMMGRVQNKRRAPSQVATFAKVSV